jgi:hypothetical protein
MISDRSYRFTLAKRLCFAAALASPPLTSALAQAPVHGFWTVHGRGVSGTRCGAWFIRLALDQGRLTGVLGVSQGNVTLQNLVLRPDGSFSGNSLEGYVNHRHVRAYNVVGRFSGDLVSVTLKNEICPDRSGTGRRQPTG